LASPLPFFYLVLSEYLDSITPPGYVPAQTSQAAFGGGATIVAPVETTSQAAFGGSATVVGPAQTSQSAFGGSATIVTQTQTVTAPLNDGEGVESTCVDLKSEQLVFGSTDAVTGGEVSILQDFLIFRGLLDGVPTGYFGFKTSKAVQTYQGQKNVPQVGKVGPLTKSLVQTDSCSMSSENVNSSTQNSCRYEENGSAAAVFGGTPTCTQALAATGYNAPGLPNVKCVCGSSASGTASNQNNPYVFTNESTSNGSIITRFKMTLKGTPSQRLGSLISVCVTPSTSGGIGKACSSRLDFGYLKDQKGWSYDPGTDTYAVNRLASVDRIPDVEYISVIRTSEGKRYELKWRAGQATGVTSSSSGTQTVGTAVSASSNSDEISIVNNSTSNSTILTRLKMTVTGAGDNVKACTAQSSGFFGMVGSVPPCSKDSEFAMLKTESGWSYNPNSDTYTIDMDATVLGWPDTTYTTIFKKMNGRVITKTFGPAPKVEVASPVSSAVFGPVGSSDIVISNNSVSNGTILTRLKMTVTGAGDNVKACTAQSLGFFGTVGSVPPCSKDSEFAVLKNQSGWSYYPNSDTYAIDMDITSFGWPDTTYTTIFKKPDGNVITKTWTK
jgi:peptidoglycan hydrolase-like protein with peptidoglycan-binding domain